VARKLAHEFRNMLTPMRLSLQVLESETAADPGERRAAMKKSLGAALAEVEHLGRLADQFSQYARLPEPQPEKLDLVELARAAAVMGGSHVTVNGPETVMVRCDRLLVSRALHNLVLNALEASPEGPVEIGVGSHGNEVEIEVRDRGPGISTEISERLFEPYVSTKKRGSGLGLSLVRDIVTQHGGHVTVGNREGGGAVARVTLPCGIES
jgi:signal transduction histidine kinase